jgi:hypothetical protein
MALALTCENGGKSPIENSLAGTGFWEATLSECQLSLSASASFC